MCTDPIIKQMCTDPIFKQMCTDPIFKQMRTDPILKQMCTDSIFKKMYTDPIFKQMCADSIFKHAAFCRTKSLGCNAQPTIKDILYQTHRLKQSINSSSESAALMAVSVSCE